MYTGITSFSNYTSVYVQRYFNLWENSNWLLLDSGKKKDSPHVL